MLGRRDSLKLGVLGASAFLLPALPETAARAASAPSLPPFSVPLAVPPVARPVRRTSTTDYYEITTRESEVEIFPGIKTTICGYGGLFPGPTIMARSHREVQVRHTNALMMETSVHLHGAHVQTSSDGYPKDPIAPGASRVYTYPNHQEAATLWYHDHAHMMEAENVFRGLSGFYLLHDHHESSLRLPSGRYDVPLMIRDAAFDDKGQIVFTMGDFVGRSTILVNGRPQPYFRVEARKYRFRIANGSNMRFLNLGLSDGQPMVQIASDGGLLPAPLSSPTVTLSAGERVEIVVDFSKHAPGDTVVLQNWFGETLGQQQIMRFDVFRKAVDHSRVPAVLRPALPDLGTAAVTRKIVMSFDQQTQKFELDGKLFDMDRIDQQVTFGDTEIWEISDPGVLPPIPHNIHLHGVHFQVLSRNGQPVSGHETGWKDTVLIWAGSTVRFKVKFDNYRGRYLYHCHLLDHSAMGMMAQMQIS